MYCVYVLRSEKGHKLYIGCSSDLKKRVKEHNVGKSLATRPYIPYQLIYYEALLNERDAKAREEYLKTGWAWRSLKKILGNYLSKNAN